MQKNKEPVNSLFHLRIISPTTSQDEVREYAKWLGMELGDDLDLFWIAKEGLKAPLPENWKPCKTVDTEEIYYFNFATGEPLRLTYCAFFGAWHRIVANSRVAIIVY